ncbi:MAG: hypothetical protein L7F78_10600 [Syntrophales bacterium LBB04]|nr:hypothetical protein [Syntrophales bacterium LBB04]
MEKTCCAPTSQRHFLTLRAQAGKCNYLDQAGKIADTSQDKKTKKVFPSMEWLANRDSHSPNLGDQMVQYHGFGITIRHFTSTGNPHLNPKSKTTAL